MTNNGYKMKIKSNSFKKSFDTTGSLVNKNHLIVVFIGVLFVLAFCFVAGTGVLLASGAIIAIEDIRVGDYVKSYNETTGEIENKIVLQTFINTTDELTHVRLSDGEVITSTIGHKFFANGAWVSAKDLKAGDILVNVNGEKVVVEQVEHEILENPVKIYNFEVQDNHTYLVGGENGVVVHNTDCSGLSQAAKQGAPNSTYTQLDVSGKVKSITTYGEQGLPIERIDYLGRSHNGVLPHIHEMKWNGQGQQIKNIVKDLLGNIIG